MSVAETLIKAVALVGNHVVAMKKNPAKVGENFMPLSTTFGLAGASVVAVTAGASETMDLHALIGSWDTQQQIVMHVALYAVQFVTAAYSAYLVGKPRGTKLDD